MYFAKNIGRLALIAAMLWLTACSGTPEAGTEPKQTPEQTPVQTPEQTPVQTPEQSQEQTPVQTSTASAATTESPQETVTSSMGQPQDLEGLPPLVEEAASTVMNSIRNKDMQQLAAWVHQEKGLRFSPYAYVDTKMTLFSPGRK